MAESHQVKEDATPPKRTRWWSFFVLLQIVISLIALGVIAWNLRPLSKLLLEIKVPKGFVRRNIYFWKGSS